MYSYYNYLLPAMREHECDRCFGTIAVGELYEYALIKNPPAHGNDQYTICHFHNYDCLHGLPDMYDLQEQDLKNIARHGQSNNQ